MLRSLPPDCWAIATSAAREIAQSWLDCAGLPRPATMVTAGDVPLGKPHPGAFQRAAELLKVRSRDLVIFEDAPAGLTAGRLAGARVIPVACTLSEVDLADHDWLPDFEEVSFVANGEELALVIGARRPAGVPSDY